MLDLMERAHLEYANAISDFESMVDVETEDQFQASKTSCTTHTVNALKMFRDIGDISCDHRSMIRTVYTQTLSHIRDHAKYMNFDTRSNYRPQVYVFEAIYERLVEEMIDGYVKPIKL